MHGKDIVSAYTDRGIEGLEIAIQIVTKQDVLNVFHIINDAFFARAYEVFNPRNAMYISRNNGMLNNAVMVQRDTLINANTLNDLCYNKYTPEEMAHINAIKDKAKLAV